jgi:broad specificity phosphatase PhoE
MPTPRRALGLLAAALLAFAPAAVGAQAAGAPTVVIIVRHADKAAQPSNDPPLTETGVQRAQDLAAALAESKIDIVMHTPTVRTRETARPTAEAFDLTPAIIPLGPVPVHAAAVAEMVRKHPGKTILVVGHSNTIMPYVAALGGPKRADLCDHEYDGLYTLIIDGSSVRLVESHYGPPNPVATAPCAKAQMRP